MITELDRLAEALKIDVTNVKFANNEGKRKRSQYFIATLPNNKQAFVKKASEPRFNELLLHEATVTHLAAQIGVPVLNIYKINNDKKSPYYLEQDEKGIIALELLRDAEWHLLASNTEIAKLSSEDVQKYAWAAAQSIHDFSGAKVPSDIETNLLILKSTTERFDVPRYKSPDTLEKEWEECDTFILQSTKQLTDEIPLRQLQNLLQDARSRIKRIVHLMGETEEYFVHGDFDVSNIALAKNEQGARKFLLFDFDSASKTHFQALAKLTDISNLISRSWSNPILQGSLIREIFAAEAPTVGFESTYDLLYASIVFGTLYLGKEARRNEDPNNPEYHMVTSLFNSLMKNLEILEKIHRSILK